MTAAPATPFDALAPTYDDGFTNTVIGQVMRAAVWRRLEVLFPTGSRVLEVNCGTGVDAHWLMRRGVEVLATDASPAMVATARARGVEAQTCPMERIASLSNRREPFDGVFSNFGGLNCVANLESVADGLAQCVRPGGKALLCIMGRVVPWEWAWFLARGKTRLAFRRLNGRASWRGMEVRYPTLSAVRHAFDAGWVTERQWGLGALVPPTYAESWARRHPRFVQGLDRLERRIEAWPLVPHLADHFVVELERR